MARSTNKSSPLDERIAELERELRQVRKSLRGGDRKGLLGAIPTRPAAAAPPPRAPPPPEPAPPEGEAEAPSPLFTPPARDEDLFSLAARRRSPTASRSEPAPARSSGGAPMADKERFANYFASGSFVAARPLRQERRVQRNKALFMIFVVLLVAFVIFSMIYW